MTESPQTPETEAPLSKKEKFRALVTRFGGIAFAIVITLVVFTFRDQLREEEIKKYGYWGLFFISVIGNATIVLPVPTFIAAFAGGGVLNPLWVGVISALGATIGEMTGYLAGTSGKAMVENQEVYERFKGWMDKYGLIALFVLAAIPNPLFDIAGIISGMMRIPIPIYFIVTWAGKMVKFWLLALLGSGSSNLFDRFLGAAPLTTFQQRG